MPNTTIAQINTELYNILDLMDAGGGPLEKIFDWPDPTPAGYPAAMTIYAGGSEVDQDTQYNELTMQFVVRVMFLDGNDKAAYDLQLSVMQTVQDEFRKDNHITLAGKALQMKPTGQVDRTVTSIAETKVLVFDLHIEVMVRADITL